MNRRLFLTTTLLAGITAATAIAQTTPPTRIRGTIASVSGNTMTVTGRDGQSLDILLNDPLTVLTVKKVELSTVGENAYVGIATRGDASGKPTALEVLVFPDSARGAGEGHYAWDLEPGSMMTNGTVTGVVTATSGRELSLKYKDGSQTITVPPSTPIVTFAPAERADLKPGAPVFLAATKNADGKFTAGRVTVGKDGVAPPM
jgi:Domain of unknown function (DUF5666)